MREGLPYLRTAREAARDEQKGDYRSAYKKWRAAEELSINNKAWCKTRAAFCAKQFPWSKS